MVDLDEQEEEYDIVDNKRSEVIILRNEAGSVDPDFQDFENIELCSSLNESLAGDDLDEDNLECAKSKKSGKKSKYNKKLLNEAIKRNTTIDFDSIEVEGTAPIGSSKDILDGMKRKIIFDVVNINGGNKTAHTPIPNNPTATGFYESIGAKSASTPNEKGHFISMNHLKANSNKNIKFTNYATARIHNEVEYNQLLECLRKLIY
jgi:hypothetical protein